MPECHCCWHRRRRSGAAPPGQAAHRAALPAGRCRRPGRCPWRVTHPHVPGPDHACQGSGCPAAAVLADPEPGQDLKAPEPSWRPTPTWHRKPGDRAHRSAASTSPTAATRGSSAPCSPPPSPHCAPTPSPRPTTSANAPKANRLGPGHPRPAPPPHPDPARHDPQQHPLQPTTINTTTRSRLTHHIGVSRKTRPLRPDTRQTVTPTCHNPTHSTANDATQPNNERSRIAALRRQTALRWDTSSAGRTISTTHPDSPGPATSNAL